MQLLLIVDHPLIHVALRALLADQQPPVTVHSAETSAQAREQLAAHPGIDLVLLDLELAGQDDGFALLKELRDSHPSIPIVNLSGSNEMAKVIRAIDHPHGIRQAVEWLAKRRGSMHEAHHGAMEALGEMIWQSQRSGLPPDGDRYIECVRRRATR